VIPFGVAKTYKEGKDVTLVAIGRMVSLALKATEVLERGNMRDPGGSRTLVPLDKKTIPRIRSENHQVSHCGRGPKTGGVGAEIAALIAEEALDSLDAPVVRVAALDSPIPFNVALEDYIFPNERKIVEAVRTLVRT
jgi:pyruvate dehydrogenase E1 component beta subunit